MMKRVWNSFKNIFTWVLMAAAVAMMLFTIVSVSTFNRMDRNLFGYKAFIVLSDSMSNSGIHAGDLVLMKEVAPETLKEGDIIAYQSTNPENYGEVVTHAIRSLTTDVEGNPGFITYGTATDTDDQNVVTYSFVIGKFQVCLPKVGTFFQFLKTTPGYIICIFIPFLLLILLQGFHSIQLFRKYKAEQLAELEAAREKERAEMRAEREKLEAERAKSEEMMAELMKMREAMEQALGEKQKKKKE